MTVLEKMKKVMQDKGISEQDLAAAIGVSKGAMHNWMKGVGKPSANAVASEDIMPGMFAAIMPTNWVNPLMKPGRTDGICCTRPSNMLVNA